MARKPRIEKNGFYHIVNRGVARGDIFLKNDDFKKFLEILQESSEEYGFEIFSFVLMSNHYHLLMKISNENLSQIMQKVNSRYSIYFNKKYNRVGPLWQGRFKSWYVYDELYLTTLARYIEFNPIKANITKSIGKYKWAMSSKENVEFSMLNFELIESIDFAKEFDKKELEKIDEFMKAKVQIKDGKLWQKKRLPIESYFKNDTRESAIFNAVKDGATQREIADYLKLSYVAISKILNTYRQKLRLFERLKRKGIFWSYGKEMSYHEALLIEHTLKYADFDDIVLLLRLFGKRRVKAIWKKTMMSDKRFIKLNLMIARIFFGMDVESSYFKGQKNERLEKLKLLAS